MTRPSQIDADRAHDDAWLNWLGLYAKDRPDDFIEHTFDLIYRDPAVREAFVKLTQPWFDQDTRNFRRYG